MAESVILFVKLSIWGKQGANSVLFSPQGRFSKVNSLSTIYPWLSLSFDYYTLSVSIPYLFIIFIWFILSLDPSTVKLYTSLCWYLHISMFFSVCLFVLFSIYLLSFFTLKSTILLCLDILLNVLARQTTRQYSENLFDHLQKFVHFETFDGESTNAGNYFIAKCWTNSLVMFMNKCNIRCVIYENQYLETNFVWRPPL